MPSMSRIIRIINGTFPRGLSMSRDWDDRGYDPGPDDDDEGGIRFADPGGRSALRASSRSNPRNLPCPNCGARNRLTPADRARGYQCDACANQCERGW
jgi:hypothetical protein